MKPTLSLKRITCDKEGHEEVESFLKSKEILPLFFYSPFPIQIWLNNETKELYLATFGNENILVVHDSVRKKDVRFFFEYPSQECIEAIISHFNATYIGINELPAIPPLITSTHDTSEDLVIDLLTLEEMRDPRVRKEYNRCIKHHPHLRFKELETIDLDAIKIFLEEWHHTRTEEQNKFSKTQNDLNFINTYKDHKRVYGGVVYDGEKVVALSFFVDSLIEGTTISMFSKILRGYTELGTYLYVEKSKIMRKKGFSKANLGKINNEFKNKFKLNSLSIKTYAHEAWVKEGWKFTPNFLQRFI